MNFLTDISYKIDVVNWNQSLVSDPKSTAYQHSNFYIPYQLNYKSKSIFITILNPSGKIVGQLSGIIHLDHYWLGSNVLSKFLISKLDLGSRLNWFQGPIIHDTKNSDEILSCILTALDKIAKDNNVNLISGSSPPSTNLSIHILKKYNYIVKPWISYITNIDKNTDEIYSSLHNKTRYDIRKGEKSGLEFEVVSTKESLDCYLDLKYAGNKKLAKIKKHNESFLKHSWNTSYQNDLEKMFLAKLDGNPVAAIVAVLYNGNLVQSGVANSSRVNPYAGSFLTWNIIRWASENNYKTFDVGGANPNPTSDKEKGINLFKSKWASENVDYFLCTKVFNKTKLNILNIINDPKSVKNKFNRFITKI